MSEKTRAFICIDLPDSVIKEIARIQTIFEKNAFFVGKLTELENLHITLKFLGEISQQAIENVKKKLEKIKFPQLTCKLAQAGTFSLHGNPKIVWVKVTGNIFELQKQIDKILAPEFEPEKRFMSHLTIARIKHTKSPEQFKTYIANIKPKRTEFSVKEFRLKSSVLKPHGPVYTTLRKYTLP